MIAIEKVLTCTIFQTFQILSSSHNSYNSLTSFMNLGQTTLSITFSGVWMSYWFDTDWRPIYHLAEKIHITLKPTKLEQLDVTDYNADFWAFSDIRIIAT